MQKVPQSICANAGIAPSAKPKMTLISTDRIMALTQQEIRDRFSYLSETQYIFFIRQASLVGGRPAISQATPARA
jgi:hypothetical protein